MLWGRRNGQLSYNLEEARDKETGGLCRPTLYENRKSKEGISGYLTKGRRRKWGVWGRRGAGKRRGGVL